MAKELITTLAQLKELASEEDGLECYILLGGGIARSSKHIWYIEGKFEILNEIDGTEQKLTEEQLTGGEHSNIYEAMRKNALFTY